ncbi:hypothetical protein ACFVVX_05360 [Kitasatospora sp. NPDC058170]|uniref:hypothetical protein n=1 Tax=Kitasatospora sp. NPDC058170 TaxID=3346364 RepID=UPI0036DCE88C
MSRRIPSRGTLLKLAGVMVLACGLTPLATTPANAYPPAGWFQLRTTVQDQIGAFRAMDVLSESAQVDGTIRLAGASITDQQRWKVRLVSGHIGDIRLENKLTGQCITYASVVPPKAVIAPCRAAETVFEAVSVGNGWVFQSRTTFSGDFKVCLQAEPGFGPHFGHVIMGSCHSGGPYDPLAVWNTVSIP